MCSLAALGFVICTLKIHGGDRQWPHGAGAAGKLAECSDGDDGAVGWMQGLSRVSADFCKLLITSTKAFKAKLCA